LTIRRRKKRGERLLTEEGRQVARARVRSRRKLRTRDWEEGRLEKNAKLGGSRSKR